MDNKVVLGYSDTKNSLLKVPGIQTTAPAFRQKLITISEALETKPDFLATAISFESGFDPTIKNKAGSGAVGLIQFLPSTAKGLGTTAEQLANMSAEDQLDYVYKYLLPYKGRLNSLNNIYMAILNPANIGQPANHVLFPAGSREYDQNKGFDKDNKGYVTVADVSHNINAKYNSAKGSRIALDAPQEIAKNEDVTSYDSLMRELFASPIDFHFISLAEQCDIYNKLLRVKND